MVEVQTCHLNVHTSSLNFIGFYRINDCYATAK